MTAPVVGLTAREFLALPHERHAQLVDGKLVVNQPNLRHQRIVAWLLARITFWTEAGPGRGEVVGEIDVHLDDRNVFAPDLSWVREERRPGRAEELVGLPDLAVEVRSPSTWRHDVGAKRDAYERAGLAEHWLVDTEADAVRVLRRTSPAAARFDVEVVLAAGDALASPLLPGFSADVGELFDR